MQRTPTARYEPLDGWMVRAGVDAADLLRCERSGVPLPVWIKPDGRVLVDRLRVHSWRELAALMGVLGHRARAA
jgi:hypothetical protein